VRIDQAPTVQVEPGAVAGPDEAGEHADFYESIADDWEHDQIESLPAQFAKALPFGHHAVVEIKTQVAACRKPFRRKIEQGPRLIGQRGEFGGRKCFSQHSDERDHPEAVADAPESHQ
jgi:hypothetical protein